MKSLCKLFTATKHLIMDIKTFVFLDCETTGLPQNEHNTTKMTEFCLVAVESKHLSLGVYPRVQNKLGFCLNPMKIVNPVATDITGLANDILEFQPTFSFDVVEVIKAFLKLYQQPICFVAHNGYYFDYPILRTELIRSKNYLPNDLLCIDSLEMFRNLYYAELETQLESKPQDITTIQERNETTPKKYKKTETTIASVCDINKLYYNPMMPVSNTASTSAETKCVVKPSFKLSDVYFRLTNKRPSDAHRAECDVNMLIHCAATLGSEFVSYANEHCKKFYDIPNMRPGCKIGT